MDLTRLYAYCYRYYLLYVYAVFLLYIEEIFLYIGKKKYQSVARVFSYLSTMYYMIDILYMTYKQGMSYLSDMLLYVYVYDTILSLYISIFMFHVKHLYVASYNCIYNCI